MRFKIGIWIVFLMILCQSACCEEAMYIRIVSRGDTQEAQMEKIEVRNAVMPLIPEHSSELEKRLPLIYAAANGIAPCEIDIRLWNPEKKVPLQTLYITVGEGSGPNWWGILYPQGAMIFTENKENEKIIFDWPIVARFLKWLGIQ